MASLTSFDATGIDGRPQALSTYEGKVVLVVNVASRCGFTPQYAGLEALYRKYRDRGFVVLGFPCNQFGQQEPGTEAEIQGFCESTYAVTFPMFSKVDVNGEGAHPLWKWLKEEKPGLLGSTAIKWNFTKFLVGRDGRVVERYAPNTAPDSIAPDVENLL